MSENLDQSSNDRAKDKIRILTDRCKEPKIDLKYDDIYQDGEISRITIFFPQGRDKRQITLFEEDQLDTLLSIQIEEVRFLQEAHAYVMVKPDCIFASVMQLAAPRISPGGLASRILGQRYTKEFPNALISVTRTSISGHFLVQLRQPSRQEALLFHGGCADFVLTIQGLSVDHSDRCQVLLRDISNSLFFEIEQNSGVALGLSPEPSHRLRTPPKRVYGNVIEYRFPTVEYPREPMALYWFASSALQSPLIQFLAFYQVVEHFFPYMSQQAA